MSYQDRSTARTTAHATAHATATDTVDTIFHVDDLVPLKKTTNDPSQAQVVDLMSFISLLMAFITFILQGGKSKPVNGGLRGNCSFFHTKGGCRNGNSCPFSHKAAANLGGGVAKTVATASATYRGGGDRRNITCKHFFNGNCRNGDSCSFSHKAVANLCGVAKPVATASATNLTCKHFFKGNCRNGDSCSFSHKAAANLGSGSRDITVSVEILESSTRLSYDGMSMLCKTPKDVDNFFDRLNVRPLDKFPLRNAVNDKLPEHLKH